MPETRLDEFVSKTKLDEASTDALAEWFLNVRSGHQEATGVSAPFVRIVAAAYFCLLDCGVLELSAGSGYLCAGVVNSREISRPIIELDEVVIRTDFENLGCGDSVDDTVGPGSFPDRVRLPLSSTRLAQRENADDEPEWNPAKYEARLAVEALA
ncbi:MAG: hypothetical protein IIC22_07325 [Chloroflexi bacterium]|nr:hypothetical protein [Chloroflexota bacterium]